MCSSDLVRIRRWRAAFGVIVARGERPGGSLPNAYISGTGFYVPDDVVTNQELATRYGIDTTDEWIVRRTGIEARRFAADGVGTSDLAVPAVEMALEQIGRASCRERV